MRLSREILRLAVPSILANLTVPLVGMVDIAVTGHLNSSFAAATLIGGISVGSMLFDLLYWSFSFLRTGTGGLTAQGYGRGENTAPVLLRSLRLSLTAGLILILLQWILLKGAFLVIRCSPEVRTLAESYFLIRIWAAPATLSLFAFKGWFIGMQDSLRPMTADLLVNGVNITASLLFALGIPGTPWKGIGFNGVAAGTVVAQYSGLLYAALATLKRYGPTLRARGAAPTHSGTFFTLSRDLWLRSVGMIAVYIGFTMLSASLGDLMLAVSTILMKFLMIFSYFTDGFAYAGEALTGRFIGEGSREGVRSTIRGCFAWSGAVAALFILVYWAGGGILLGLMTSDEGVVEAGRVFLPWLLLMPLIGCPAFVWDGIYIGATASSDLRNATLLCATGFFAVWIAGTAVFPEMGAEASLHLLMGAYFVHLAVRALYLTLRRKRITAAIPATAQ